MATNFGRLVFEVTICDLKGGRILRPPFGKESSMDAQINLVPMERIERAIILIRGEKVMLDSDLAQIYGVG